MKCRLFVDEIGNDDLKHPDERYLSLTGIITKVEAHDRRITPEIERLKADLFGHSPPTRTVVLHRREILRREPPFEALRDPALNAEWERRVLDLVEHLPYIAITVMIDKHAHRERYSVWHFNPYHYCMRALLERFVLWLHTHDHDGDVVVEPRFKKVDKKLKTSFAHTYDHGTEHIGPALVQRRLTSKEIKFAPKGENVAGLQLVELIAHPGHHGTKAKYSGEPMRPSFGRQIYEVLERARYRRKPETGLINGWGQKWLP